MRYQYDDNGTYFYYFCSSVLGIFLVPYTWSLLKQTTKEQHHTQKSCKCESCEARRRWITKAKKQEASISSTHIVLAIGWFLLGLLVFKAATTPTGEQKLWDPFEILGLGSGASTQDVKKAFRKLSLQWHPDKVEAEMKDEAEQKYVELTKAYKALTDDEARKNWEEYGHPDGKQSFSMGIALPSWIVNGSARYKLLALYGLIFGIGLPWFVGRWWKSTKIFTRDGILNNTMAQFYHEMKENMNQKQLLELLATADEFQTTTPASTKLGVSSPILTHLARGMSPPTPEQLNALQKLIKDEMEEKTGSSDKLERPKRFTANQEKSIISLRNLDVDRCWKVYLLLMAHIVRAPLDDVLEKDRQFVVSKSFHLLSGMLQISQAYMWLNQVLNIIDLQQMLVQAVHPRMPQLWQLPNIDDENIKYTKNKKRPIKSIVQFMEMKDSERRDMFRGLTDEQYNDMVNVAATYPVVEIVRCEPKVVGEKVIEPGAFVTLFVKLKVTPAGQLTEGNGVQKTKDVEKDDDDVENMEIEVLDDEGGSGKLGKWWENQANPNDPVHAPFFPPDKRPGWWVLLGIPLNGRLVVYPQKVINLTPDSPQTVKLGFQAPNQVGLFPLTVFVKSDSWMGCDISREVKLKVDPPVEREEIADDISEPEEDSIAGLMAQQRQGGAKKDDDLTDSSDEEDENDETDTSDEE